jgi:hypothetical protein
VRSVLLGASAGSCIFCRGGCGGRSVGSGAFCGDIRSVRRGRGVPESVSMVLWKRRLVELPLID